MSSNTENGRLVRGGKYLVYPDGSVYLIYNGSFRKLKPVINVKRMKGITRRYWCLRWFNEDTGRHEVPSLSNLLAEAFIPNTENSKRVFYKDGNPLNCVLENITWKKAIKAKQLSDEKEEKRMRREIYYKDLADKNKGFLSRRERAILEMRMEGKTLQEIGDYYGVTRERVRQIIESLDSERRRTPKHIENLKHLQEMKESNFFYRLSKEDQALIDFRLQGKTFREIRKVFNNKGDSYGFNRVEKLKKDYAKWSIRKEKEIKQFILEGEK